MPDLEDIDMAQEPCGSGSLQHARLGITRQKHLAPETSDDYYDACLVRARISHRRERRHYVQLRRPLLQLIARYEFLDATGDRRGTRLVEDFGLPREGTGWHVDDRYLYQPTQCRKTAHMIRVKVRENHAV